MWRILAIFILFISCVSDNKKLPILSAKFQNGTKEIYTISFEGFINQDSQKFNATALENKVSTANFFFTRCPSICPPMRTVQIELADYFADEEHFIQQSFTIDLERDSVSILKKYALNTGVPSNQWQFLRGREKDLERLSEELMSPFAEQSDGLDINHSSHVALLDKQQRIRGFYNLLKPLDVEILKKDITFLLNED